MHIAIIYEDKDRQLYNAGVADLNEATTTFKHFVSYRNNQFRPEKNDAALEDLLDEIEKKLLSAEKKIVELSKSVTNEQYNISAIQNRVEMLTQRLQEQKDFLKRYLSTTISKRKMLFNN